MVKETRSVAVYRDLIKKNLIAVLVDSVAGTLRLVYRAPGGVKPLHIDEDEFIVVKMMRDEVRQSYRALSVKYWSGSYSRTAASWRTKEPFEPDEAIFNTAAAAVVRAADALMPF